MAKKTYKTVCTNVTQQDNRGNVTLAIGVETTKDEKGQPVRVARQIVQLVFNDPKEAASFVHGKEYTVTVEG